MADNKKKESYAQRAKQAYKRGYVAGFEDCEKQKSNGNRFWGKTGYSNGYKDKQRISKIRKRLERYKNGK